MLDEAFPALTLKSDLNRGDVTEPWLTQDAALPLAPSTLAETGLSPAFLQELALKAMHYAESPAASHLASVIGLPTSQVIEIVNILKRDDMIEIVGGADYATGRDYRYRLTEKGAARAERALDRCRYAGTAPVTLRQYEEVTSAQKLDEWRPSKESAMRAFRSLVLDDVVIERMTSALRSGRATMVFGPSGNGKSHVLASFVESLEGEVIVPSAIYANGQIIRIFDPRVHVPIKEEEVKPAERVFSEGPGINKRQAALEAQDRRWIRIKRPGVIVGGEIGAESLELGYDPLTRFYQAPAHLKAQGGVFVVDDFGRQKVSPAELLNRWIMSLERGREQLMMRTGEALDVPFHVTILFSTNLNPDDLADSAYLRRIPYKVYIPDCRRDQFKEVLERACQTWEVQCDDDTLGAVTHVISAARNGDLNGALPRDLISILAENYRQAGAEPVLTVEAIERAYRQFTGIPDDEQLGHAIDGWSQEESVELDSYVA